MERKDCYRNELKYEITYEEYLSLQKRLRQVMKSDAHARDDGTYLIRSIYFDNIYDKALREKINGAIYREKFRIRYYNDDFSFIALEKKIKYGHLCKKEAARLTEQECQRLFKKDTVWMKSHKSPLVRELYFKMKTELIRPRILVSYIREPYVFTAGNVRVTFDSNIRTSLYGQYFLKAEPKDISASDTPEDMILEIKYDEFLPEIISHLIQTGQVRQQAFSKYAASRRFG